MAEDLQFKVHTPRLLKEIADSGLVANAGVLKIPLNVLRIYLGKVAERAIQLDDPIMNELMCQMALYEIGEPTSKEYGKLMADVKKKADAQRKQENKKTYGLTPEQIKHIEEYSKTGKYEGKKVTNLFTFARQLGTSTSTMDLYFRQI